MNYMREYSFQLIFRKFSGWILACFLFSFASCGTEEAPAPKPYAYYRIDLPEKKYSVHRDECPFEFEYPGEYALVLTDTLDAEPCWKNLAFPKFKAEVNLSYKRIDGNLNKYLEDSWSLATKHQVKASGMPETIIRRDSARVFGLLFDIEGNAASSLQFFVTDSTRHFLRGALYFYAHPNYDSLAPVISFLKKDVEQMISTLRWTDQLAENKGNRPNVKAR